MFCITIKNRWYGTWIKYDCVFKRFERHCMISCNVGGIYAAFSFCQNLISVMVYRTIALASETCQSTMEECSADVSPSISADTLKVIAP